jgi:hypothetical protein
MGKTTAPIAIAANGNATIANASVTAQAATRSVSRQSYKSRSPSGRQNPFSPQRFCAPSTAENSAPTAPMPRPATRSSFTPASCSARSTPA